MRTTRFVVKVTWYYSWDWEIRLASLISKRTGISLCPDEIIPLINGSNNKSYYLQISCLRKYKNGNTNYLVTWYHPVC